MSRIGGGSHDTRGPRRGVLLVNLGTPASPAVADVRRYLREFLGDPRVLDIPAPLRWLLLHGVILPFRPRAKAAAYRKIWTPAGSPLLVHGRELRDALAKALGERYAVELAMRYGRPSIPEALERLEAADVDRVALVPLFPQYASATTGSAVEAVLRAVAQPWNVRPIEVVEPFYDEPSFIAAWAAVARNPLAEFRADHLLLSFHGLPEHQIRKGDPSGGHCLVSARCCNAIGPANRFCYRAHCFATARALADALGLPADRWSVSFQSRLGRRPWLRPFTDRWLPDLASRGVRRLAVACPSFVADCLETHEEIAIQACAQWQELGGEDLRLLPCPNAHPRWVEALASWVRAREPAPPRPAAP